MFMLADPTCDEADDVRPAIASAIRDAIGRTASVVAVSTVLDLVAVTVQLANWHDPPPPEPAAAAADLRARNGT